MLAITGMRTYTRFNRISVILSGIITFVIFSFLIFYRFPIKILSRSVMFSVLGGSVLAFVCVIYISILIVNKRHAD